MAGYMCPWWVAMHAFITRQRRAGGLTPLQAGLIVKNFLASGAEGHRGAIIASAYHSTRITQGYDMLSSLATSPLGRVQCRPYLDKVRRRVPSSIRHDPALSASFTFFSVFEVGHSFRIICDPKTLSGSYVIRKPFPHHM
jgi:hypothetical protein